jgi:hypothetical protein
MACGAKPLRAIAIDSEIVGVDGQAGLEFNRGQLCFSKGKAREDWRKWTEFALFTVKICPSGIA